MSSEKELEKKEEENSEEEEKVEIKEEKKKEKKTVKKEAKKVEQLSPFKVRLFKCMNLLGTIGILMILVALFITDMRRRNYNFATDSIGELFTDPEMNSTHSLAWNFVLLYQYTFAAYGFMFNSKKAGFGSIIFILSMSVDRVGYSLLPHKLKMKPTDSKLFVLQTVVVILFASIGLLMTTYGYSQNKKQAGIYKILRFYSFFILTFLISNLIVQLNNIALFGLTQKLYTYPEFFMFLHLSLYMIFKAPYTKEEPEKIKTD